MLIVWHPNPAELMLTGAFVVQLVAVLVALPLVIDRLWRR